MLPFVLSHNLTFVLVIVVLCSCLKLFLVLSVARFIENEKEKKIITYKVSPLALTHTWVYGILYACHLWISVSAFHASC